MPQKGYAGRQISSLPVDKFKSYGLAWSEPLSKTLFKQENPGPMCTQEGNTLKYYPRGTFAHPIFKEVWLSDCAYWLSHVWFFATPWTIVCQASLPMAFSRQEYWSGLPCLPPTGELGKGGTDMLQRGYQNLPEEGALTSGCDPGADCLIWMAWRLRKPSAWRGKTNTRESEPTGCSDWENATVGTLLPYPRQQWFYCVYDIC